MTDATKPAAEAAPKPTRLNPVITLDAKFFWDRANQGELAAQKCSDCGEFRFPPRPMCPKCHSVKRDEIRLSGRGSVVSWIRPIHPPPVGFKEPPTVAIIELEEGFRMVSNVIDIAFEDITPGLPVGVCFDKTMSGRQVPVFRPADPHPNPLRPSGIHSAQGEGERNPPLPKGGGERNSPLPLGEAGRKAAG